MITAEERVWINALQKRPWDDGLTMTIDGHIGMFMGWTEPSRWQRVKRWWRRRRAPKAAIRFYDPMSYWDVSGNSFGFRPRP